MTCYILSDLPFDTGRVIAQTVELSTAPPTGAEKDSLIAPD